MVRVSTVDANQKFLRVFESDVKGSTASSSSTHNVAFVSENTSSTNDVSTAYGVSNSSVAFARDVQIKESRIVGGVSDRLPGKTGNKAQDTEMGNLEIASSIVLHAYTHALKKVEGTISCSSTKSTLKLVEKRKEDKDGLGTSDIEDSLVNDRYAEGMHAVPPLMTGIYIPSGLDKEIDDSQFTYGPKKSKPSESDARKQ
ncbi:hypothetical protein Tco_0477489 [Tanacetum coccineum]